MTSSSGIAIPDTRHSFCAALIATRPTRLPSMPSLQLGRACRLVVGSINNPNGRRRVDSDRGLTKVFEGPCLNWTSWIENSLADFDDDRRLVLTELQDDSALVDLYNELISRPSPEISRIAALAASIANLFKQRGDRDPTLLFLELQARCHLSALEVNQGFAAISEMVDFSPIEAKSTALELVRTAYSDLDRYGSSIDHRPRLLAAITSVLERYEEFEELAGIYLEAALLYSRHGASQAAYRMLESAEAVVRMAKSFPLLARFYAAVAAVSAEEPDYECSAKAARKALKAYRIAKLKPPPTLLSNLGVARMNLDQLAPAVANFRAALRQMPASEPARSVARVNLAACLRRLGDFNAAAEELAIAEAETVDTDWPEYALELLLGKAKLAEAQNDTLNLITSLKAVALQQDKLLADILRLHHRRGIRERYLPRIEALLRSLPDSGAAEDALLPLVATRGNAFGDWLAILDWAESVCSRPAISREITEELVQTLTSLRHLGVPHLYGFREKYDDAWGIMNYAGHWDTLSLIARKLGNAGLPRPVEAVSSQQRAELCRARLGEKHCLMAMTYSGASPLLWCFIGDRYGRQSLPLSALTAWKRAQLSYALGEMERGDFLTAIKQFLDATGPIFDLVFSEVARKGCASVRYLQDSFCSLPLTLLALRNATLAQRMEAADFEVRVVPALHPELEAAPAPLTSAVAIIDPDDGLPLAPFEGAALAAAAGIAPPQLVTADQEHSSLDYLAGHDVLIVSTHGNALELFSDAYFARLGTPDRPSLIGVGSLQEVASDLALRLVLLNTCYSGSASDRNFQQTFRTSDAVTIPALFLLNRRAVAVGGLWKLSDTTSFMFASLVGSALATQLAPSAALAKAIAELRNLTKPAVLGALEANLDATMFATVARRLQKAPDRGMFSNSYFTGGLVIYGLL